MKWLRKWCTDKQIDRHFHIYISRNKILFIDSLFVGWNCLILCCFVCSSDIRSVCGQPPLRHQTSLLLHRHIRHAGVERLREGNIRDAFPGEELQCKPRMSGLAPKWDILSTNGTNSGTFSDQISVQFGFPSQNILKFDPKKSQMCSIWGQSELLCSQPWRL